MPYLTDVILVVLVCLCYAAAAATMVCRVLAALGL